MEIFRFPNQTRTTTNPDAQRDRLPWFWFFFTVAVLLLSAMDRYHIVSQFKQRERVVIIDPAGTYYLSPLLQFSEARDLHVQQAELATMAFLERNPKDFDNPDLFKLMFLKPALAKAQDERVKEMVEFRAKQLHQKAEIGQIDILATRDNEVLAAVTGQIIRSGIFQDKAFTDPNDDLIMHEQHVVYRVEENTRWDFHPGPADGNLPALPSRDAAFAPAPVNDAILAEVNSQKAATTQIMMQARTLSAALAQFQAALQQTKTNIQETLILRVSHTPLDGDFRPSQNMLLGARCGLARDRRQLVWEFSTKLEHTTPTL